MKRNIYKYLLKWKQNINKKPLIIKGQRQVGKTYITKLFAQNEYKKTIYINFLDQPLYKKIFEKSLEPIDVYKEIYFLNEITIDQETLIILDEFQECDKSFQFLKTLNESKDYSNNVIAIGSWVEASLFDKKISFPVGQVSIINMYPMTIDEYIWNAYSLKFINEIKLCFQNKKPLSELLHNKLIDIYHDYLQIGGMPEIVKQFINTKDKVIALDQTKIRLSELQIGSINDIAKYGTNYNMIKMLSIYDGLAVNLNRPYNKFKYSLLKKGTQARNWNISIDFMIMSQVAIPTYMVKKPLVPLEGNYNIDHFKLYFSDIGFLISKTKINTKDIIEGSFSYMGWITENFVAIHLNQYYSRLFYWYKDPNEVDFLINVSQGIVPIEVKSGRTKRSNSLNKYKSLYKPQLSMTISKNNFLFTKDHINIPIYAIFLLENI